MMGVPLACSALLMRKRGTLLATNGMGAEYLFHEDDDKAQYALGDLGLQCGRRTDAFKLWFSWQVTGRVGYAQRIDHLFEMSSKLGSMIEAREGFELARTPQGPNVCFRYLPPNVLPQDADERKAWQGRVTEYARAKLMQSGEFMINYADLDGVSTFRSVSSNPVTSSDDLTALLDGIERVAQELNFSSKTPAQQLH